MCPAKGYVARQLSREHVNHPKHRGRDLTVVGRRWGRRCEPFDFDFGQQTDNLGSSAVDICKTALCGQFLAGNSDRRKNDEAGGGVQDSDILGTLPGEDNADVPLKLESIVALTGHVNQLSEPKHVSIGHRQARVDGYVLRAWISSESHPSNCSELLVKGQTGIYQRWALKEADDMLPAGKLLNAFVLQSNLFGCGGDAAVLGNVPFFVGRHFVRRCFTKQPLPEARGCRVAIHEADQLHDLVSRPGQIAEHLGDCGLSDLELGAWGGRYVEHDEELRVIPE